MGLKGTPSPSNVPGGRRLAVGWTDRSGNLWLFGGISESTAIPPYSNAGVNDLWRYSGGEWTWMSGSNMTNQAGSYGTQGTPAPGNVPGARSDAVSWIDASGNFWLFGG